MTPTLRAWGAAVALTAAALTAAVAAPAGADERASETPLTRTIRYDDLDLARAADARQMAKRLRRAVSSVCPLNTNNEMDRAPRYCRRAAPSTAVAAIDAPRLTAQFVAPADRTVLAAR